MSGLIEMEEPVLRRVKRFFRFRRRRRRRRRRKKKEEEKKFEAQQVAYHKMVGFIFLRSFESGLPDYSNLGIIMKFCNSV